METDQSKQELLLAFYRFGWEEMTWRRNAGYRTVILGFGYFGVILTVLACKAQMERHLQLVLGLVIGLGTLFGAGYLLSNYKKYMSAAGKLVLIEEHLGAFDSDFLGKLGALMPASRRDWPKTPIGRDVVCLWSVLAFLAGGLGTAAAIIFF